MKTVAHSVTRCARCRRALEHPTWIAGLPFGSECKNRAGMLSAALEAAGLELPVTLEMIPLADGFRMPEEIGDLGSRAVRAGLMLRLDCDWVAHTVTLTLRAPKSCDWVALENNRLAFVARLAFAARLENTVQHANGSAA